jgi:hypothetical protein
MTHPLSTYTQEIGDLICAELAEGISLRTVCKADGMPDKKTVFRWLRSHPEFAKQYAIAKEEAADAWAEEILDIADDGTNDWITDEKGRTVFNGEHVQRSRVRIDTRKWIASKLKPKKYGDKITHEGSEDAPIVVKGAIELVRPT